MCWVQHGVYGGHVQKEKQRWPASSDCDQLGFIPVYVKLCGRVLLLLVLNVGGRDEGRRRPNEGRRHRSSSVIGAKPLNVRVHKR
jgi:hypothetical protein